MMAWCANRAFIGLSARKDLSCLSLETVGFGGRPDSRASSPKRQTDVLLGIAKPDKGPLAVGIPPRRVMQLLDQQGVRVRTGAPAREQMRQFGP